MLAHIWLLMGACLDGLVRLSSQTSPRKIDCSSCLSFCSGSLGSMVSGEAGHHSREDVESHPMVVPEQREKGTSFNGDPTYFHPPSTLVFSFISHCHQGMAQ